MCLFQWTQNKLPAFFNLREFTLKMEAGGGFLYLYAGQEVYVWLASHIVQSSVQQFAPPQKKALGGYCFYFMVCGGPRMFQNEETDVQLHKE